MAKRARPLELEAAPDTPTRKRLLAAALALFAERGYDGVSTAEIARRAQVAEKTLFANFQSKERLYDATLGPASLRLVFVPEALRTLVPIFQQRPPADLAGLLRRLIENRLRFAAEHTHELRLLVQHVVRRPESFQVILDAWATRLAPLVAPLLAGVVASGSLRADIAPTTLIRIVGAQVFTFVLARTVLLPDYPWDDERGIATLVDVLLDGLRPRTPARKPRRPAKRRG